MEPDYDMIPMTEQTAKVDVYRHCDCSTCKSPKARWFSCPQIDARYIATYMCCRKYVDRMETPHPDCVAWIKQEHPGADLVYA